MDGGGRTASGTAVESNAGAVADDCRDAGGRTASGTAVETASLSASTRRDVHTGRRRDDLAT
jgi:hypothetical protein